MYKLCELFDREAIFQFHKLESQVQTHINVDSFLREDLQFRSVVWNESVELEIVFVPFDRVEDVALHLEVADETGAVTHHTMRRNVNVVQYQRKTTWKEIQNLMGMIGIICS